MAAMRRISVSVPLHPPSPIPTSPPFPFAHSPLPLTVTLSMPSHWLLALVLLACTFLAPAARAAELPLDRYQRVDIAPTRTSIYIGSISMTMPTFVREKGTYSAPYSAKVFPYFFYNEKGTLSIEISDDTLRALERGEVIQFTGRGVSSEGESRHVEGRAIPDGPGSVSGKIKVRVFVSKKIQLIFNTTYHFPSAD